MDSRIFRMSVLIGCSVIYFLIVFTMPLRVKMILKKAGKPVYLAKGKMLALQIFIIVCSAAIIAILVFRELGLIGDSIACLVAILGVAMGTEELALYRHCGVYENGIINAGHYLALSEIHSIPRLKVSSSSEKDDFTSVRLLTDKMGSVTLFYANSEDCAAAIDAIVKLKPSLKP